MTDQFTRTRMLLGDDGIERLKKARVAVFGLGGVGSYVAEALARSGVGTLDIVDDDVIVLSNLNRLLYATHDNIGQPKTEVVKARIASICPETVVYAHNCFYLPETADRFDFSKFDYVADAIDTVSGKLQLVMQANAANVPVISCMGTGNKLDPTALEVADISKTSVCPLARVMRRELRKRGIDRLKVVYSKEPPIEPNGEPGETLLHAKRQTPGSCAFVPSVAGLILAGEIVRDLCGIHRNH
ncbi:MAG: tRNA threonylcarbamoyladenosine dehydratase [Clostridia bacterium]|nr:tRNA threonylcarbamoyladenosine dehydratase [Clostridia bacterium]